MRRFVLLCLVACGCDWDAAERKARCNAGDPTACDGGTGVDGGSVDGGSVDGGGGVDGGGVDGGGVDGGGVDGGSVDGGDGGGGDDGGGGLDGGSPGDGGSALVDPTLGPIGLFPRGDAGALSLASNTPDGGLVAWFDAQGTRVDGGRRYGGRIISAYADGVSTPMFAAIVAYGDGGSRLEQLFEDGRNNSTETQANHVTVYFTAAGIFASVWTTTGGSYVQEIYLADLTPLTGGSGSSSCEVIFHDLEVLRVDEGTRVVIPYSSALCSGVGGAEGVSNGTGIQSITSLGARSAIPSNGPTRVGRFSENGDAGFDVCGPMGADAAFIERFDFNRADASFSPRLRQSINTTTGTIELGDVSGGVVVGQATDRVTLGATIADDGGFTAGTHTVFAAAPFAGWVRALGRGIPGSNVKVVRQGNTVFVAYLVDDGGTSLVRLDALSGTPLP